MIEAKIKEAVRDISDFPKPGIVFKDITPIFQDPQLCGEIIEALLFQSRNLGADAVVGVESRGFLFGLPLANALSLPFAPVRKKGKLPYDTVSYKYDLEYGSAEIEMHTDAIRPGMKVIVHDDLLATGGTAAATADLIRQCGAEVCGFSFVLELQFLKGREMLKNHTSNIATLASW